MPLASRQSRLPDQNREEETWPDFGHTESVVTLASV